MTSSDKNISLCCTITGWNNPQIDTDCNEYDIDTKRILEKYSKMKTKKHTI